MSSTTQPTTKGNKNTTSSRRRRGGGGGGLFSFGACFGLKKQHRKKLYQDPAVLPSAHALGESAKYGSKKPEFDKSDLPTSESIKEIQIVAAKSPPPLVHQLNDKIDQEMIAEEKNKNKNKKQEQSIVQETSGSPMMKLRHSISLPARPEPPQPRLIGEAGKVDSMVGVSVIALTLAVMLIWGKVCAILCSAAWVFFVQYCFKQKNESFQHKNDSDNKILDLDSHEYKKRVVLQGFLQRI
ncbi:uncharacterized protein [Henckelia pumila]|uniref:uncharacterized protein n=1 Tax=Henckelia pumila TaxID=405737 RepID=UPI003C6DF4A5